MKKFLLTLFGVVLASSSWASSGTYDYPLPNPYAATVIGTPTEYQMPLPEKIRLKMLELTVFEGHKIPDVFWYQNKLRYSLAYQKKKKAPLIFVIAGTGASFYSSKM
ncbi:MAG: alpha/beta hydrolase, partial [Deltaproteobacteria bacterium]|nr:alpha/beta hydrolase [Deltaproteobacteria bacterium]